MSAENKEALRWVRAQGTYVTGSSTVTKNQAVLHSLILGTYTPGAKFRLANGTATAITNYITGTFVPTAASLQQPYDFKELEFPNGIYVETAGTLGLTAIYNDLV